MLAANLKLERIPVKHGALTVALIGMLGTCAAHATDDAIALASCSPPTRPPENVPPSEWRAFLNDVERFRSCTQRAMDHHQQQAAAHQTAARSAADAWNEFVRTELNAPQDFPHPSDGSGRSHSRTRNADGVLETHGGYSGTDPNAELKPQFEVPKKLTIRRKYPAPDPR